MASTRTTPQFIVITDLDGTLLDRDTYGFEPAEPALHMIRTKGIPLILASSKTRAEIELYRKRLDHHHPFISENGGAVFVPKDYFSFSFLYDREIEEYLVLELGTFYPQIIEVLESIKKETGIKIKGFSDLTEKEISSLCGLALEEASLAKRREYDEPFLVEGGEEEIEIVKRKIEEKDMNYVWGGRFHHLLGQNDKGKSVDMIKELFEKKFSSICTIGIGNSLNDLPLLLSVDYPIFLKGKEGPSTGVPIELKNWIVVEGDGPEVWNDAILSLVNRLKI
jgi:mannosyl-3-phosphoglycerate phosphatase